MTSFDCSRCGRRTDAGNCPAPHDDGHVIQCVGEWADNEKHEYLRRYIDATREVRRRFGESTGFIDLFAGPGLVRNRDTGDVCEGSPLIAAAHDNPPFYRIALCDLSEVNVDALRIRMREHGDRVRIVHGDANDRIGELIGHLPRDGFNLALIDPFALRPLSFATVEALARLPRMDLIINFPTGDLRRNQRMYQDAQNDRIDRVLGNQTWRGAVGAGDFAIRIMNVFIEQLEVLGYTGSHNRTISVTNSRQGELYRLVFASKHGLGDKIWTSITQHRPDGQRGFPWA